MPWHMYVFVVNRVWEYSFSLKFCFSFKFATSYKASTIYTTIKTEDVFLYVCHVYAGHLPIDGSASYFTQS